MGRELAGQRFGRWTVLARVGGSGPARWNCACDCGTQRDVAAKNLISGMSTSCGCLTKERVREARRVELTGQRFGKLTVVARSPEAGAAKWKCICDCGNECVAAQTWLNSGKKTNCGCESRRGKASAQNAAGVKYGMLTAVRATDERDRHGSVIWECACDCGNDAKVSYYRLKSGAVRSCGCMQRRKMSDSDGRCREREMPGQQKLRADSTTGVTGVRRKGDRYEVYISYRNKRHYLGKYDDLDTAVGIRRQAEALIARGVQDLHFLWDGGGAAAEHPDDAAAIGVRRQGDGVYVVEFLPAAGSS